MPKPFSARTGVYGLENDLPTLMTKLNFVRRLTFVLLTIYPHANSIYMNRCL
jgi:hypothetical protein